jgi:hypothetical protein
LALRNRSSSISGAERLIWLVAALSAIGCRNRAQEQSSAVASATPSAPATQSADAQPMAPDAGIRRVGETAQALDYAFTLAETKVCDRGRIKARPGHLRIGARVEIEAHGDREVPVNPFYARVVDAQRDGYAYTATFGGCEPDLKSSRIGKGERMSGWITFEIPEHARGLELSYSPFIQDRPEQTVTFSLGR